MPPASRLFLCAGLGCFSAWSLHHVSTSAVTMATDDRYRGCQQRSGETAPRKSPWSCPTLCAEPVAAWPDSATDADRRRVGMGRAVARNGARRIPEIRSAADPAIDRVRRDVLRQGCLWHPELRRRAQPGQRQYRCDGGARPDPHFQWRRRVRRAPAPREDDDRGRGRDIRPDTIRVALRRRGGGFASGANAGSHRAQADPVDSARLRRWAPAFALRSRIRHEPHSAARHLHDVLGPRRLRLPGGRPRRDAGQTGGQCGRARRWPRTGPGRALVAGARWRVSRTRLCVQVGWHLVAFAALCVAWDIGARRATGFRQYGRGAITDAGWLVVSMAVVPLTTYIVSWSGWFSLNLGWDRNYAAQHGVKTPVISALYSLWEYHREMWHFHVTLHAHHPYQSQPWTWLVMSRPVAFYYTSPSAGHGGCHVAHCSQEVLAIGTPAIWWASIAALTALAVWWLVHRDWRAGAVLIGVAAGWLPWFAFPDRTKFFFYAVSFEPYLILAITLCLGLIIGSARSSPLRRGVGAAVVGGYLLVVVLNFFYLYPILAAKVIPYSGWHARMWFARWI